MIYVCVVLFLSSLVLPASVLECSGQADSATVAVSPSSITASVGQGFSIGINISSVSDLYGWEFYLGWNSSLLSLVSVNEGPFLRSGGNTYFTYYLNTTTTDEHVIVDCTLEGPIPGVSGDGTLATITFNVTNEGQCALNLYNVDLRDSSNAEIPSEAVSGNFTSLLHDVAVTNLTASPIILLPGGTVNINVTVQNEGSFPEVFNVTVYANSQAIGVQPVSLGSGSWIIIAFAWNTTGLEEGDYTLLASASVVPGEVNTTNNSMQAANPITLLYNGHDVAVTKTEPLKTVVGQGYSANITATVKDYGVFSETFNTTIYAGTKALCTQAINLESGASATLTIAWITAGFAYGNYTISAYAWPVPGETNTANNNCTGGWVIVAGVGDVTGSHGLPDGVCDMTDVAYVASVFGMTSSKPGWQPNADLNNDGVIDISDVAIVAAYFGKVYPYPPYP
jgi:hypothetical protein